MGEVKGRSYRGGRLMTQVVLEQTSSVRYWAMLISRPRYDMPTLRLRWRQMPWKVLLTPVNTLLIMGQVVVVVIN
jgi:hypothetical protein